MSVSGLDAKRGLLDSTTASTYIWLDLRPPERGLTFATDATKHFIPQKLRQTFVEVARKPSVD